MRPAGRRRLDLAVIALGSVVVAGVSVIGGIAGDTEKIERMWVGATLRPDGTAVINEIIDYDFGTLATEKHGIFRDIPGLSPGDPVTVASPTAPAGIDAALPRSMGGEPGVRLRIGDANKTVTGAHRYVLAYVLDTLVNRSEVAWDAVGAFWEVPISEAEIHVVGPWDLTDLRCDRGSTGDRGGCDAEEVEPGHLVVHASDLDEGEGISVYATAGADLPAGGPALPEPPSEAPADEGAGLAMPAAVAALGSLGAGASMARAVRRRGRDRVSAGGATDAAFAGTTGEVLLDTEQLDEMATTDVAPPDDISAPIGGVILAESVRNEHKVAWLIEAAIAGAVDLVEVDGKTVRIDRTGPGTPETAKALDSMFGGRSSIELGSYDKQFARGWGKVGSALEKTAKRQDLWDAAADRRRIRVRVLGVIAAIVGLVGVGVGGAMAASKGEAWLPLVVGAALVTGAGMAATVRGWELRVRTPKGSGLYLRVESFRRFLHGSEAFHAEEAAKRGVLREYTAWAVAVGEIDRWSRAVSSSTVIPESAGLGYVYVAPMLFASTSSASTAPSSSSGGGGGGGGVGGGGGGGGGGSW